MSKNKLIRNLLLVGSLLILLPLIIFFTWPLPKYLLYPFIWVKGMFEMFGQSIILLTVVFVQILLGAYFILPILCFVLRRLYVYISLLFICLKRGYKYELLRSPFSSLLGIKEKADIQITKGDNTYKIHFIDIIFRYRRVLLFTDGCKYVITPACPGKPRRFGGDGTNVGGAFRGRRTMILRSAGYYIDDNVEIDRPLPDFSKDADSKHILMLQSVPVDTISKNGKDSITLTSDVEIGEATFYFTAGFKKFLKR